MKYFWIFCVFGGKVGCLNLTVVLCELKEKCHNKCYFGLNLYCGKLTYVFEINVMSEIKLCFICM